MKKKDFSTTTRREFLEQLAIGAGAMGIAISFPSMMAAQEFSIGKTNDPKNILVLGAGLAGLAAAWELEKAGHQVRVLEARDRPGGRVSTLHEPFAEGLYAEEGAVGFSETYSTAIKYIEELGLERKPFPMPQLPVVHHLNGERFVVTPGEPVDWPYELSEEERELGPWGLVTKYIFSTLPAEISQTEKWNQSPLVELDEMSLTEYMSSMGASEGAIELVQNTQYFAIVPEVTSALSVAVSDFGLFMGGAPFVLVGGNDSLPRAMAENLKEPVHYGVEVSALNDSGEVVTVTGKEGGREISFSADQVICTLPATVMRRVEVQPPLAAEVEEAFRNMPYLDVTRTYLQVERPFWLQEGISGSAFTDLPIGGISAHTHPAGAAGHPAVLESYVSGSLAKDLGQQPEQEVIQQTLEGMENIHPQVKEHFQKGHVKAWGEDAYALGGISWPAPGDVGKYLELLQRSHGRIHFAGEHTSILRSTMEGALRSGVRAAMAVQKAGK